MQKRHSVGLPDYTPTPHQVEDCDAILDYNHALLWADPGTGKTVTAMLAFQKGRYSKMVVVCPKNAMTMWANELSTQLGMRVVTFRTGRTPPRKMNTFHADAIVVSVDLAKKHRDYLWRFAKDRHAVLVLDEAHLFKSHTAQRTKSMFGMSFAGKAHSLVSAFADVWQLTGTPITRYYDDLFTQLRAVRADVLAHYKVSTYDAFVNEFCVTQLRKYGNAPAKRVVVGNKNINKMEKMLKDCKVIRRKLSDVVDDLPDITYRVLEADYSNVDNPTVDMDSLIRELNDSDSVMSKVRRQLGVAKAASVCKYLDEQSRFPILVGYWHKDVAAAFLEFYESTGKRVAVVDGSTSTANRDLIMAQFNNGDLDMLFGQMQAMNTSWNLQKLCRHVVIAEELPSPAMLEQFIARVYRRGQVNHVQVDFLRAEHNLDQALHAIREIKGVDIKKVI